MYDEITLFWRSGLRLLPVLLALSVLLLGCGTGATTHGASTPTLSNIRSLSTPGTTTYLGTVPGTQAFIGLVMSGQEVRVYVCDGTPTRLATLADWFTGQVQNGALTATSQRGVQLQAQVTAQSASGTLTLSTGQTLSFTAPFVADTSRAGVYEGTALLNGQSSQAGWVVLPSGDQRGAAFYPSSPVKGVKGNIALVPLLPPCGRWSVATSPNPGGSNGSFLNGVATRSATDAWAVGEYIPSGTQTLIEHWNGTTWSVVTSPSPGSINFLYGVAAVSATDVWAVGSYSATSGSTQALIEHWNGTTWSVITWPSIGQGSVLYSVSTASADWVWAVGSYLSTSGLRTLVVRWNGSGWSFVYTPSPGPQGNELHGVSAHAANDVWAVGDDTLADYSHQALALHWDGASWSVVPSASTAAYSTGFNNNYLVGVSARAANDVWVVGKGSRYGGGGTGPTQPLIEHWDGTTWRFAYSAFFSSSPGSASTRLSGVAAVSASNAWAVGTVSPSSGVDQAHIEHWDGRIWSAVTSPGSGAPTTLNGVVALSGSSTLWAVGSAATQTLTEVTC